MEHHPDPLFFIKAYFNEVIASPQGAHMSQRCRMRYFRVTFDEPFIAVT